MIVRHRHDRELDFQVQVWVDEDNEVRWEGLTKYRCLSMDMERYSKSD